VTLSCYLACAVFETRVLHAQKPRVRTTTNDAEIFDHEVRMEHPFTVNHDIPPFLCLNGTTDSAFR